MAYLIKYRLFGALICCLFLGFTGGGCTFTPPPDPRAQPEGGAIFRQKPVVSAQKAMVVAANPLAAEAGLEILKKGGSAVDALITTQLMLNLVEPQSSGIGGGGFLLVYDPLSKTVESLDGRETAPRSADGSLFLHNDGKKYGFFEAAVGGRAVGTPGLLALLAKAHQSYGILDWQDLFDSPIKAAKNGFHVSPRLHNLLEKDKYLKTDPASAAYFYLKDLSALPVGSLLKNPELAKTFEILQTQGIDPFYKGQLGKNLIDKVHQHATNPGLLDAVDLATYEAKWRAPVCRDYRETYRICGMGPPSSGGLSVLEILGLIEAYDQNNDPKPEIDRTHLLLEASKLAFADRNQFMADSDFIKLPVLDLLKPAYLIGRQTLIQHDSVLETPFAPGAPFLYSRKFGADGLEHGYSTTHISVVDQNGLVVSMTSSIENAFGSRQMVDGYLLNNQLTDFSFLPEKDGLAVANRVEGGKRPRSSMSPMIVLNKKTGQPILAIGSPGGSRIIGYVAQSLIAILDDKMALNEALAEGHIVNRNGKSELEEDSIAIEQAPFLESLGHKVRITNMTSGLHAIRILPDGTLQGAADPRREGVALGY